MSVLCAFYVGKKVTCSFYPYCEPYIWESVIYKFKHVMKNYADFANEEVEKLYDLQNKFVAKYDINSFENWFYDHESELIRFYNDNGTEILFKYIPVGTYSLKSNTWMWSWYNEGSIEAHKDESLKVEELGEKNNFEFLTKGIFEFDESECWQFVAISKSLIGGLGVYRTNSKELNKYFILTEEYEDINSIEVKRMKQKNVDCGMHGFRRPAFVCKHLSLKMPKKGFEEAFDTYKGMDLGEDEDFATCCDECEKHRLEQGGWNDESEKFADIKLVCEECYFELKGFNKS